MEESLKDGHVEVWLEGKKISGGYALIHTGGGDDNRWLLVKMNDEKADARRNPTSTEPDSVLSGRSLDDVSKRKKARNERHLFLIGPTGEARISKRCHFRTGWIRSWPP